LGLDMRFLGRKRRKKICCAGKSNRMSGLDFGVTVEQRPRS
jgi:hypothetical protein